MLKFKVFTSDEELKGISLFKDLCNQVHIKERQKGNLLKGVDGPKLVQSLLAAINSFEDSIIPLEAINPVINKFLQIGPFDLMEEDNDEYVDLQCDFEAAVDPAKHSWRTHYYPDDIFLLTQLSNKFEVSEFAILMAKLTSPLGKTIRHDLSKKIKGEIEDDEFEDYWFSLLFLNIEAGIVPLNWFVSILQSITTKKDSALAGEINDILEFITELMNE